MPLAHIVRESPISDSFRTAQVMGMFDVPHRGSIRHEWDVELPLESHDWKIGLIVGSSGSGKTTIARELFPHAYFHERFDWPAGSLLDGFPAAAATKDIVEALSSVGLSSPPMWIKPFAHLSNGQQFRAELARSMMHDADTIIFDEFTSVVDRTVAQVCSAAVSKLIRRRHRPQLVAVSCHFDIIDWLQPDWLFDVNENRFEWRSLRRKPPITLRINETPRSTWQLFRGHHYLSADLHPAAKCYLATWQDVPVAFVAVILQPHNIVYNFRREHRVVVLPDFQGVGIGNAVSEFIAAQYTTAGYRYISVTSHPAMIRHRLASPLWACTRAPAHGSKPNSRSGSVGRTSVQRLTASFEFKPSSVTPEIFPGKAIDPSKSVASAV
jgi:GNAT superfamily N-acetyltransferase